MKFSGYNEDGGYARLFAYIDKGGGRGRFGWEAEQSLTLSLSDSGGGGRVQPAWGER